MVNIRPIKRIDPISFGKVSGIVAGVFTFIFASVVTLVVRFFPNLYSHVGVSVGLGYILRETLISLLGVFISAVIIAYLYNLLAPKVGYIMIEI